LERYALDGLSSSFVLEVVGDSVVVKSVGDRLKEFCRRLLELYMDVPDDTILPQQEFVF